MSFLTIITRAGGGITSRFLLFQRRTWRVEVEGREELQRRIQSGDRVIVCFWHGKYIHILPILSGVDGCVFTCTGRSGNIIAKTARDFGFHCIQIPHRSGRMSLQMMENALSGFRVAVMAADGPIGPYHQVKQGVIRLASRTGYYLLPVSVDAQRKWILKKRWDLMEIPFPFTKVCLAIGGPIAVPESVGQEGVAVFASRLRHAIDSMDAVAAGIIQEI